LSEGPPRRPLVVIVDIDDDISDVLGVSVVRGEGEVLKAALEYSRERPEDADLNAMFTGLSLYRKLRERGLDADIAVVGGDRRDIVEAQVRVRERVKELVRGYSSPVELYIVGDGLDEVMVAEILGDIAPVAAVKRVIVEQHAGVETSYALLLRYARKALSDPRYSRYALGIPGVIVAVVAFLALLNLVSIAFKIALLLLGIAMAVKGFNVEEQALRLLRRMWEDLTEMPHIKLASITLFLAISAAGASVAYYTYRAMGLQDAIVSTVGLTIPLILIGATLYILVGNVVREAVKGDIRVLNSIALALVLVFGAAAFHSLGASLDRVLAEGAPSLSEAVVQALFYSRFIPNMIIGIVLAGLIELITRIFK